VTASSQAKLDKLCQDGCPCKDESTPIGSQNTFSGAAYKLKQPSNCNYLSPSPLAALLLPAEPPACGIDTMILISFWRQ
jgi:hypothetical protein